MTRVVMNVNDLSFCEFVNLPIRISPGERASHQAERYSVIIKMPAIHHIPISNLGVGRGDAMDVSVLNS